MISGDNFYGYQSDPCASYHFSRHVHIWGWATWRRAWRAYDGSLARYRETVEEILHAPRPDKFRRYWRKYLRGVIENPTTWDIQWCVAMAANKWPCANGGQFVSGVSRARKPMTDFLKLASEK